jgi:rhodanese-related sulfurtransferase
VQPKISSGEWLLVDARDEDQFTAEHIPGALSLPAASYEEMLLFFAEEHGREKPVVIYCGTEDCEMSAELAMRLRDEAGWTDIRILEGGILAWRRGR